MRAVIQRVSEASVEVNNQTVGEIGKGYLVLLGIEDADDQDDVTWLADKLMNLRIFSDEEGKMNLNLQEAKGKLLLVSQFTLHAKTKKGNRPSFIRAAKPDYAEQLFEDFKRYCSLKTGEDVASGIFGADMKVKLINDGPVTITIDTKNKE